MLTFTKVVKLKESDSLKKAKICIQIFLASAVARNLLIILSAKLK